MSSAVLARCSVFSKRLHTCVMCCRLAEKAKRSAVGSLNMRSHSRGELQAKLLQKGYSSEHTDGALAFVDEQVWVLRCRLLPALAGLIHRPETLLPCRIC